ncbi:MAG TPA: MerR family transcriptional regulator [Actinomycetota bacterium]|jgi:DNA-binding transcriptional MerR regulator
MSTEYGASIGEVSALLGIPVPTLRSWERRYGAPRPARTEGGHRRYTEAEVEQLRRIRDGINPGGRRASDVVGQFAIP